MRQTDRQRRKQGHNDKYTSTAAHTLTDKQVKLVTTNLV